MQPEFQTLTFSGVRKVMAVRLQASHVSFIGLHFETHSSEKSMFAWLPQDDEKPCSTLREHVCMF